MPKLVDCDQFIPTRTSCKAHEQHFGALRNDIQRSACARFPPYKGGLFQDRPGGPKFLGDFASWNIDFLKENRVCEV